MFFLSLFQLIILNLQCGLGDGIFLQVFPVCSFKSGLF